MASSDSKIEKMQKQFQALSSVASSLNAASDELTKVVAVLDESLKKLNVGLHAWVTFGFRSADNQDPEDYDEDQIGYSKVKGIWGIALRHIWGNASADDHEIEGPWLFNDAPREMRLRGVDKIPMVIEQLCEEASHTTKKVLQKTQEVRALTSAIEQIANTQETGLPPSPFKPAPDDQSRFLKQLADLSKPGGTLADMNKPGRK
jgi:hypothetical protein